MTADAQQFSEQELADAVRQKDRGLIDLYLASRGVNADVRAFIMRSKPNREKTATQGKEERDLRYAQAKLFYTEQRKKHDVERARDETLKAFPMHIETLVRITEGDLTHVNRICAEISSPDVSKSRGKSET